MKFKVYFDMDGVLADFGRGLEELCGLPRITQKETSRMRETRMWDVIREIPHYYDRLELIPGAAGMFRAVYDVMGDDCEILTGIPRPEKNIRDAGEDKRKWISRILSDKVKVNVVYKEEKREYCSGKDSILIDDYDRNIEEWRNMGGTGILFENCEKTLLKLSELGVIK